MSCADSSDSPSISICDCNRCLTKACVSLMLLFFAILGLLMAYLIAPADTRSPDSQNITTSINPFSQPPLDETLHVESSVSTSNSVSN